MSQVIISMGSRDPQEHIKLRPQILNILMELSSSAQDERNSVRFDSLRKLTELINLVYANVKLNGVEIDGLVRNSNQQLEEISTLHKKIKQLEKDKQDIQATLDKSHHLIRQMLMAEPALNSKIPQHEIKQVLGGKEITHPVIKQYLKFSRVA